MKESSHPNTHTGQFKYPAIEEELGEFERVAQTFGIEASVLMSQARSG